MPLQKTCHYLNPTLDKYFRTEKVIKKLSCVINVLKNDYNPYLGVNDN